MCVHICVYAAVRAYACMRMRACAERIPACARAWAWACARAAAALSGGRRKGATFHLGITVHMHIITCTRARMYTCMRALAECIPARVGVGVDAGARAGAAGAGVH
jgi:hypothetical protein